MARNPVKRRAALAVPAAIAALFLAVTGCATVPRAALPAGPDLAGLLPPDSLAYAALRVSKNANLVTSVLRKSRLAKSIPVSFAERTERLYLAAERDRNGRNHYSLVAQGDYPAGLIRWRLNWSRDWRRESQPLPWWRAVKGNRQIALPARSLLLVSDAAMPTMLQRLSGRHSDPIGPTMRSIFAASDLVLYVPKVQEGVGLLGFSAGRFPVESFYLALDADASSGGYSGYAAFKTTTERDARLFSVVFKLLIASASDGASVAGFPLPLAGAQLSVVGSTIRLNGLSIGEKELSDLLSLIVTGGKPGELP